MAMEAPDIHSAEKIAQGFGSWVEGDNQRLTLVIVLEIEGVVIEGLLLRGSAYKDRPDEAVLFQLECNHDPARRDRAIERIDWRPLHTHTNGGKGPKELRHKLISGTHHHRFELNWLISEERMRLSNLPIAEPVNLDIRSYEKLIDFVGECFRITELKLPPPPWEAKLL